MNWIEIFKAGEHTDSNGNTKNWTEQDLNNMVTSYNPEQHEAPCVIGHPKDNAPSFGWIEKLKRVGDKVLALPKQVVPEFEEMVSNGMFKKRSVSLYPDGTLRHVGFLGAMPPAVKGLKDIAFTEGEEEILIEFSENYRINSVGRIFQNMRDWLIGKFGVETADMVVDQYSIDSLKQDIPDDIESASNGFSEDNLHNKKAEEEMELTLKEENAKLQKQVSDFSETIKTKDAEITALKNKVAEKEKTERKLEFESFCEGLVKGGKLLPVQKENAIRQLEAAHQSNYEFSEEGEDKKISAVDNCKAMLSSLPKTFDFSEIASKEKAGAAENNDDAADIAKRATEFKESEKAKGRDISITEAVQHVIKK